MTEQENKKVLSLGGAKPKLELKKPISVDGGAAAGSVKQSFSHGRTKTVAVEVKQKKRGEVPEPVAKSASQPASTGRTRASGAIVRQLTPEERDARARALRGAVLENERRESERALEPEILP